MGREEEFVWAILLLKGGEIMLSYILFLIVVFGLASYAFSGHFLKNKDKKDVDKNNK